MSAPAPALTLTSTLAPGIEVGASVFPDFDALGGTDLILEVLGALLTIVLIFSLLMLLVSIIAWALGASAGNAQVAARGRTGVLVSLGAATLAGGAVVWTNWLIGIGTTI